MEKSFYFIGSIFLLIGCIWVGFKILEMYLKYRAEQYPNNLTWFLSQLYILQNRCLKAGEASYAESIGRLIKFHGNLDHIGGKPGDVGNPITNDGLSTQLQMKKQRLEEMKEFVEQETEFIG